MSQNEQSTERLNAGYRIEDSIHIGDSEFVLGVHTKRPETMFVTWKYSEGSGYYWGHYYNDRFTALKDLVSRAQEEILYVEQRKEQNKETEVTR